MDKEVYEALRDLYFSSKEWRDKCSKKKESVGYRCERCGKLEIDNYSIRRKTNKRFEDETSDDLEFICNDCVRIEQLKNKKPPEKKKKTKKDARTCNTCYFSSIVRNTSNGKYNLWCNYKFDICRGGTCKKYKKGKYKEPAKKYYKHR